MNNFLNVNNNLSNMNINEQQKNKKSISKSKTENGTPVIMPGEETNKDLFLQLLVAQMSNQDPLNPQDPTQYVTQLAQFSTLEQMQGVNEGMGYLIGLTNGVLVNSAMSTATALIGKRIEAYAPDVTIDPKEEDDITGEDTDNIDDKKTITGVVEGIKIENGIVYMEVRSDKTGEVISIEYGSLIKVNENTISID